MKVHPVTIQGKLSILEDIRIIDIEYLSSFGKSDSIVICFNFI